MEFEALSKRVDALLAVEVAMSMATQAELYNGALGVMRALYGSNSSQERDLRSMVETIGGKEPHQGFRIHKAIQAIRGVLSSIKSEIESGFVGSVRASVSGEVLADLIKLARVTLDEPGDDAKNVACVLSAAAFEDTLRKLADLRGLPPEEKLADVLSTLKDAGVLQGAQVAIAQSYLSFRNRALHAKWPEVDRASAHSVLSFTQQLLASEFK